MKRPPLPLAVFAIAYMAFIVWEIATDYQPAILGRLAVILVLSFFVFRGSRVAGNILAAFLSITALVLLVTAMAVFNADALDAFVLTATAALHLLFAACLFFSPSVRKFQGKAPRQPPNER